MKTVKYILVILFLLNINCCVNQTKKDEKQIKKTVIQYFKAFKENDLHTYNSLIYNSDNYPGITASELFFLNKNYNKINSRENLLDNIKIKDTTDIIPSVKMKYVQYVYKNEKDSNNMKKPLIITLMFYKQIGFNKIYQPVILQNHIGWDK
ncbi:hypothetical protein [Chryseobacterium fistulae]|uniref:Nuclear transport factor 2 family protein n=1 Tax=Chryseobacterium fistulae TaxID=2675058 RepID=A0A6N4XNY5_9FLAO|nr:hypothetical protein [Chryseobacterium fistulae]CAA7386371.1 hypothetical protein CHRY9393_00664 [Chryseobacterium fistulae]